MTSDATGGLWTIEFGGMRTEKKRCVLPAQLWTIEYGGMRTEKRRCVLPAQLRHVARA